MRRGSLSYDKGEDGRVYVSLPLYQDAGEDSAEAEESGRVQDLKEEISYLRSQLDAEREAHRRTDHLLAAALERIPQIEAPETGEASTHSGAESSEGITPRPDDTEPHSGSQEPEFTTQGALHRATRWLRGWFG